MLHKLISAIGKNAIIANVSITLDRETRSITVEANDKAVPLIINAQLHLPGYSPIPKFEGGKLVYVLEVQDNTKGGLV